MISIIIPTRNEEKILEKTLLSLRKLHTIPYEIIVSDGKSTDRTIEIAKKYADKVIVYSGEKRQTIGMARNLGAKQATGDTLLFLDADIYISDPNMFFSKAISIFERNRELVALTVFLKVFKDVATFGDIVVYWLFNRMVFVFNNIMHHGASPGEFQMIRTSTFKQVGGFNEKLVAGEDFDLFARLSKIGRTRSESSLFVLHTSRRAHRVGWLKLLWTWFLNWFHATFFGEAWSKEWEEIR